MSRLPSTGPSLQRYLREQARAAQRQQQSSPFNLSGVTVTPDGLSIPNDVLVSPVLSQSVFAYVSNFTLTTKSIFDVLDVIKTVTITVPAGFTAANVSVISRVFAYNNNSTGGANTLGADYFAGQTCIAGTEDYALSMIVLGQGSSGISISPLAHTLTGLTPGDTFNITIGANSYYLPWAANPLNTATVSGNILWFR